MCPLFIRWLVEFAERLQVGGWVGGWVGSSGLWASGGVSHPYVVVW